MMNSMTLLMTTAAPALLLGVAAASILNSPQQAVSDRARLNVLRGLLCSLGVGVVAYLVAQTVLLARGSLQSFTPVVWLPLVIFCTAAVTAVWNMRNIQRQALVRAPTNSTKG